MNKKLRLADRQKSTETASLAYIGIGFFLGQGRFITKNYIV